MSDRIFAHLVIANDNTFYGIKPSQQKASTKLTTIISALNI